MSHDFPNAFRPGSLFRDYPRPGIPFVLAFLGGFILPPLLIIGVVAYRAQNDG